ncbi:MAG: DNA replication/repair protein RecF [Pseudomonadota bacterium]
MRRLDLSEFRSYREAALAFDGRPVVLTGANGAGKTNLLEAISLFSPGRGLRSAGSGDFARQDGQGGWAASIRVQISGADVQMGAGLQPVHGARRQARIDGATVRSAGAFSEFLRIAWLTPSMDRLFVEGPGGRRRFLDRLTLAHEPEHAPMASAFERAMRARQKLLNEGGGDETWLAALERQMAEAGVALAAARRELADRLQDKIDARPEGVFPHAEIAVEGDLERQLDQRPAADVEDAYVEALREGRRRDAAAGRTLSGPHRTDLVVRHRENDMPARLCSTGEQKALLVGLLLAHARLLSDAVGGAAAVAVLLDEIAAHLDDARRCALFDEVCALPAHCFMTGADLSLFDGLEDRAQFFEVRGAAAHPI